MEVDTDVDLFCVAYYGSSPRNKMKTLVENARDLPGLVRFGFFGIGT